jgi:ABC-type glycerol-3-phosphate transport system permease component
MGLIDNSFAVILPAISMPLGLFLMKQFIDGVPVSILDSARIDGANEFQILIHIVMPVVKPAWLTLLLFAFQELWRNPGSAVLYSEEKKLLPFALNQVLQGGFARTGAGYAVTFLMMIVPIVIFLVTQSNVIQTMASSGIKE